MTNNQNHLVFVILISVLWLLCHEHLTIMSWTFDYYAMNIWLFTCFRLVLGLGVEVFHMYICKGRVTMLLCMLQGYAHKRANGCSWAVPEIPLPSLPQAIINEHSLRTLFCIEWSPTHAARDLSVFTLLDLPHKPICSRGLPILILLKCNYNLQSTDSCFMFHYGCLICGK